MTIPAAVALTPPRRLGRSVTAVFLGFLTVVVLSLAIDQLLHVLHVYPPWGQPMYDNGLCLLALSYRVGCTILGSYLTAKLAPRSPLVHVWVLAILGLAIGTAGAIVTIPMKMGPAWYPIALAISALPCAWIAGALYRRRNEGRA
jgi:hypothetical protein